MEPYPLLPTPIPHPKHGTPPPTPHRGPALLLGVFKLHCEACTVAKQGVRSLLEHFFCLLICRETVLPSGTKLRQGNIVTSMCQEFCPEGGLLRYTHPWADTPTPPFGQTPPYPYPRADTPLADTPIPLPSGKHPSGQIPPWQTPPWQTLPG